MRETAATGGCRVEVLVEMKIVVKNMNCFCMFCVYRDVVYCVVLSVSGRWLVMGGDDWLVKIWCAYNGLFRAACRGYVGEIMYVVIDL